MLRFLVNSNTRKKGIKLCSGIVLSYCFSSKEKHVVSFVFIFAWIMPLYAVLRDWKSFWMFHFAIWSSMHFVVFDFFFMWEKSIPKAISFSFFALCSISLLNFLLNKLLCCKCIFWFYIQMLLSSSRLVHLLQSLSKLAISLVFMVSKGRFGLKRTQTFLSCGSPR